ncbi:serine/threonine-protein kinase Nek8-like [Ctenocephalides felis]|uniref:serine/threonine-protein kinase Nek8-like n=1 Tax=Ctenocephalides felis TaxID=7515 RepID=UPI000E6E431E|nr:serine/threonine-protein kinase Nek8-like [Ctenocephalides felis]
MATYQKPFKATSLPALVAQIMKGEFEDLPSGYSPELTNLVKGLLEVDIAKRASASETFYNLIPQVYKKLGNEGHVYVGTPLPMLSKDDILPSSRKRSILYQLKSCRNNTILKPIPLPAAIQIKAVSVSTTHFILVTEDGMCYSWGKNSYGQLGHGETSTWNQYPHIVKAFDSLKINNACAGCDFSIFLTNTGHLYSCGSGSFGCLGLGDPQNYVLPTLINLENIVIIKNGPHHVVALDNNNNIFTWGKGFGGALGSGDEMNRYTPIKIQLDLNQEKIENIFCGYQVSAFLLSNGTVMICGCNTAYKIGILNSNVDKILIPEVINVDYKVNYVSFGEAHTAMIVEGGYVIMFGENKNGQLGIGSVGKINKQKPVLVKNISDRFITHVECGPNYTICVCENQCISIWGVRHTGPRSNYKEPVTANLGTKSFAYYLTELNSTEILTEPEDILVLFASESQIEKDNILTISGIYPLPHSILIAISTTAGLDTT